MTRSAEPTDASSLDPYVDGLIQADWGDKKAVTDAMLIRLAGNIKFLRDLGDTLQDSTDPEIGKTITSMTVDLDKTYGMIYNSGQNRYEFDSTTHYTYATNFKQVPESGLGTGVLQLEYDSTTTTAFIDKVNGKATMTVVQGTAQWNSSEAPLYYVSEANPCISVYEQDTNKTYTQATAKASMTNGTWWYDTTNLRVYVKCSDGLSPTTHRVFVEVVVAKNEGPWIKFMPNNFFYVGYKRDEVYWCDQNPFSTVLSDTKLKSVARAQSWTATSYTGTITGVDIMMQGNCQAEDRCYVELRNYNTNTGVPGNTVYSRVEVDMRRWEDGHFVATPLQHPVKITSGTKYCWVVRSPYTSYQHHIGVGGWLATCKADPYSGGDAYTSYDNCTTWTKHGRNEKVTYGEARYAPQDYSFQVRGQRDTTQTYTVGTQYVYFKPIKTNPVTQTVLSTAYTANGATVTFEVSKDRVTWYAVNSGNSWTYNWTGPNYPTTVYVRATMTTTLGTQAPQITNVTVNQYCNPATAGYLRTTFYAPKTGDILGGRIWSGINAPTTVSAGSTVLVDIIKGLPYEDVQATYTNICTANVSNGGDSTSDTTGHSTVGTASNSRITSDHHTGAGCIQCTVTNQNLSGWKILTPLSITTGEYYSAEVWVKATAGATLTAKLLGATESTSVNFTATGSWQAVDMTNQFLVDSAAYVEVITNGQQTATILIDDVQIEWGPVNHPWVVGAAWGQTFNLKYPAAEDLISCLLISSTGTYTDLMEGTDYTVNYTTDVVTLTNAPTSQGPIKFTYYPCLIRGITPTTMGTTGVKLDVVTDAPSTAGATGTRYAFTLTYPPVDPLRSVTINGVAKYNKIDYTLNPVTQTITFLSEVAQNADLEIKYTPYISDTSLAIGYRVTRPDTSGSSYVYITPWYFQVRV